MRASDILRKVADLRGRTASAEKPRLYEVWEARVPPGKFWEDGRPMTHYMLVMTVETQERCDYRCLMINTPKDGIPHCYELSPEQAADAGVSYGVFRTVNPYIVRGDQFIRRIGTLPRLDALEIEKKVVSGQAQARRRPKRLNPRGRRS